MSPISFAMSALFPSNINVRGTKYTFLKIRNSNTAHSPKTVQLYKVTAFLRNMGEVLMFWVGLKLKKFL